MKNRQKRSMIGSIILLLLALLVMTSCEWGEWPIGRDTVAAWKQGKIQIQRTPDHGFALVVDHKDAVSDIKTYRRDGCCIYMITYQSVFIRFGLEDESTDTWFDLESITDRQTKTVFTHMIEAQDP